MKQNLLFFQLLSHSLFLCGCWIFLLSVNNVNRTHSFICFHSLICGCYLFHKEKPSILALFNLLLLNYNSRNGCLCVDLVIQKINLFYAFNKYEWLPILLILLLPLSGSVRLPLKLVEFCYLSQGDR